MTGTLVSSSNGSGQAVPYHEKWARHERLMELLDSDGAKSMTNEQIAATAGVTLGTVQKNIAKRRRAQLSEPAKAKPAGGEAWRRIEALGARYPGREFTVNEIAAETGLQVETARAAMAAHGLTPAVPSSGPGQAGRWVLGDQPPAGEVVPTGDAGVALSRPQEDGEHRVRYVGVTVDGTLIASVAGTDLLWRLKLDRPL